MKYSKTTNGFYASDINYPNPPDDLVEITAETHAALMAAQSTGKIITSDAKGHPIAIDPPAPSREAKMTDLQRERDRRLAASDFSQLADAPLDAATKIAWQNYRQQLRDLPSRPDLNLDNPQWPQAPNG